MQNVVTPRPVPASSPIPEFLRMSVLVPTYRRPDDLRRCLQALQRLERAPDEVIVTVRDTDEETREFLASFPLGDLSLRVVAVTAQGVIAAMNAGVAAASGDIIALTDDDAAPWPDWLTRIDSYFRSDPTIAGVGGRDWVYHGETLEDGAESAVGIVQWHGRVIGNHHIGVGPARYVDLLKGVNCAYRAEPLRAIGFDSRLWGSGAQVHWELALGQALTRAGWRLLFDPAIGVDHGRGQRFDEDQRDTFNPEAQTNAVHNETLLLLEGLSGVRRICFGVWGWLIGTRVSPGLAQLARCAARGDRHAVARWRATRLGVAAGWKSYRKHRGPAAQRSTVPAGAGKAPAANE